MIVAVAYINNLLTLQGVLVFTKLNLVWHKATVADHDVMVDSNIQATNNTKHNSMTNIRSHVNIYGD